MVYRIYPDEKTKIHSPGISITIITISIGVGVGVGVHTSVNGFSSIIALHVDPLLVSSVLVRPSVLQYIVCGILVSISRAVYQSHA